MSQTIARLALPTTATRSLRQRFRTLLPHAVITGIALFGSASQAGDGDAGIPWADCNFGPIDNLSATTPGMSNDFGSTVATDGQFVAVAFAGTFNPQPVRVFRREGNEFVLDGQLVPPAGWPLVKFGAALLVCDDGILVGSPNTPGGGGVAIYVRSEAGWALQGVVTAPTIDGPTQGFGASLARTDDLLVVGAPQTDLPQTDAGAVWILQRAGGAWQPVQKVVSPAPMANRMFGQSVAIAEGRVLVGEPIGDDWPGAVHEFAPARSGWTLAETLSGNAPGDRFGHAIDVDGDTLVVGAPRSDEIGENCGAVHVYERLDGSWRATDTLFMPQPLIGGELGYALALDGDVVVVGAPEPVVIAPGPGDDSVHVFRRSTKEWHSEGYLFGIASYKLHGRSVAMHAGLAAIGSSSTVRTFDVDGPDCDGDGVPDGCGLKGSFTAHSGVFGPLLQGEKLEYVFRTLPLASGPVSMQLRLQGLSNVGFSATIRLNGAFVDSATFPADPDGGCAIPSWPGEFTLDEQSFNLLVDGGDAVVSPTATRTPSPTPARSRRGRSMIATTTASPMSARSSRPSTTARSTSPGEA